MVGRFAARDFGWLGLAVAPAAWAVATQGAYTLVGPACGGSRTFPIAVCLLAIGCAAAAGVVSYRGRTRGDESRADARPHDFLAWLGAGAALISTLVIANQLGALIALDPCLR